MSIEYLDKNGLTQLWGKIKEYVGNNDNNTTYSISMSGNVITITGSDQSVSSINLPIYTGDVTQ